MEDKLDLRAEKAIRNYIAKLFVVPTILLTTATFFLGYFINNAAHNEAQIRAYDKFNGMIAKLYDDINETRKKIVRAEAEITSSYEETENLLKKAKAIQNEISSIEAITKAKDFSLEIASNEAFQTTITENVMEGIVPKVHIGDGGQCVVTQTYQMCWGSILLNPSSSTHTRDFYFNFPLAFNSSPVVTNGINANSSGWAFSVYQHNITSKSYSGAIVEHTSRKNLTPVTMNYIAIGSI